MFLPCVCVELLISPPGKQKVVNNMTATSDTTNILIPIILYHVIESVYSVCTMISQETSQAVNFICCFLIN